MSARYMITHSLLSSWLYALKENPFEDLETEKNPLDDFLRVLKRQPTETTKAMKDGIDFEDLVTEIIHSMSETSVSDYKTDMRYDEEFMQTAYFRSAEAVATVLNRALLQVKSSQQIRVHDMDILLYGRLDALKAGTIYDIKYSKSYERGKYYDSTQHPTYFELVPEAERFVYLVSNGSDVWSEEYKRSETQSIIPIICDFIDWLTAYDLLDTFKEYWTAQ